MTAGEQGDGRDGAEKAAMERHAAMPYLHNLQRVLDEMAGLVEQHVTKPSAEDYADDHPTDQIGNMIG